MERPLALVVDRDEDVRGRARDLLSDAGIESLEAASGPEALELLRTRPVRIALVDPGAPGVLTNDFLTRALRARPSLVPLILATGPNPAEALRLLDDGAYDLLDRSLDPGTVRIVAARALNQNRLLEDLVGLREELRGRTGYRRIVGRSAAMERTRERLERHADLDVAVHFQGEDGVGKELAARTVHEMSARAEAPFATLDCASLGEEAIEVELFGRGAAGEAERRRTVGLLEVCAGGAIFLREIGAMPFRIQIELARAMRARRFRRVGGEREVDFDVRFYTSSRRPLEDEVEDGRVSDELRRALAPTVIEIPALRERREDVALLAQHFLETICEINDLSPLTLSPDALRALENHEWTGNVRELRNALEQAVIVATERTLRAQDLPRALHDAEAVEDPPTEIADRPFRDAKREVVDSFERSYLSGLLQKHRGNVTAAAQQAGMLRSALQRLLRKHSLRSVDFRARARSRERESSS